MPGSPRRRSSSAFLAAFLATWTGAACSETWWEEVPLRGRSEHFTLRTERELGPAEVERLLAGLEGHHATVGLAVSRGVPLQQRATVVELDSREEVRERCPAGGVGCAGEDWLVTDHAFHPHELVHVYANQAYGRAVPGLSEGLAETLSCPWHGVGASPGSGRFTAPQAYPEWLDDDALFTAGRQGYEIAQAWVFRLIESRGLDGLLGWYDDADRGTPRAALVEAFQARFDETRDAAWQREMGGRLARDELCHRGECDAAPALPPGTHRLVTTFANLREHDELPRAVGVFEVDDPGSFVTIDIEPPPASLSIHRCGGGRAVLPDGMGDPNRAGRVIASLLRGRYVVSVASDRPGPVELTVDSVPPAVAARCERAIEVRSRDSTWVRLLANGVVFLRRETAFTSLRPRGPLGSRWCTSCDPDDDDACVDDRDAEPRLVRLEAEGQPVTALIGESAGHL